MVRVRITHASCSSCAERVGVRVRVRVRASVSVRVRLRVRLRVVRAHRDRRARSRPAGVLTRTPVAGWPGVKVVPRGPP